MPERCSGAVLTDFSARCPNIDVTIVPEATSAPGQWLSERKLDVALVASEGDHGSHIRLEPLFRDEMVALVGRGHVWYGRKRIELTAFADQHLWTDANAFGRGTLLSRAFDAAGDVRPAKMTVVPVDGSIPLEMARANLGVSILPRWSIESALADGGLHAVSLGAKGLWLAWSVATRAEPLEAPLASFVDVLRARHPRASRRRSWRIRAETVGPGR